MIQKNPPGKPPSLEVLSSICQPRLAAQGPGRSSCRTESSTPDKGVKLRLSRPRGHLPRTLDLFVIVDALLLNLRGSGSLMVSFNNSIPSVLIDQPELLRSRSHSTTPISSWGTVSFVTGGSTGSSGVDRRRRFHALFPRPRTLAAFGGTGTLRGLVSVYVTYVSLIHITS